MGEQLQHLCSDLHGVVPAPAHRRFAPADRGAFVLRLGQLGQLGLVHRLRLAGLQLRRSNLEHRRRSQEGVRLTHSPLCRAEEVSCDAVFSASCRSPSTLSPAIPSSSHGEQARTPSRSPVLRLLATLLRVASSLAAKTPPSSVRRTPASSGRNAHLPVFSSRSGRQQVLNLYRMFTRALTPCSTDPIWFYCGIPTHCQKGMFGCVCVSDRWSDPDDVQRGQPPGTPWCTELSRLDDEPVGRL